MKAILKCIGSGVEALGQNKRLVIPFYLANLLCALLLILPVSSLLDGFVENSLMRQRLDSIVDFGFILEFLHHNSSALVTVKTAGIIAPALFWIVSLYLSAGAISCLASQEKTSIGMLFKNSVDYVGRFTRLALMGLPLLAACYCLGFLADLVQRIVFGEDPYQYISYWFAWIKTALSYFGLMLFGLIFDYARIDTVLRDEKKVRKALWRSIKFNARHLLQTAGIALILVVFGALVMLIFFRIGRLYSTENWAMVVFLIGVQQIYIAFRVALTLVGYGSHTAFYKQKAYLMGIKRA